MKKEKTKFKRKRIYRNLYAILAVLIGIAASACSYSRILKTPDEYISNYLYKYNPLEKADDRIVIVAIDDDSISEYGEYKDWSRDKLAEAVSILSENNAAVIGLDTDLSQEKDEAGDKSLVEACEEAGNVIALANGSFEKPVEGEKKTDKQDDKQDNTQDEDDKLIIAAPAEYGVDMKNEILTSIDYPYQSLLSVVGYGVSNATQQSLDGTIRNASLTLKYEGEDQDSYALALYKAYQDSLGLEYSLPELDTNNLFGFNSIYNTDSYQIISFLDLINGNYDESVIEGNVVIIGEYSKEGKKQAYYKYITSDFAKQEVLVEASILQTLLNDDVVEDVPEILQASAVGIFIAVLFFVASYFGTGIIIILYFAMLILGVMVTSMLNQNGNRVLLMVPMLFITISLILHLIINIIIANFEKRMAEKTLQMYVDKQIVDEISDVAPFALGNVSERREIAVLFVDIRGFTSISEKLQPEQVVKILNDYFTIVYLAIQAWNGMVDKFIGDAAMAIFNAPREDDNYLFNAICAADDIMRDFKVVKERFLEEYGEEIDIGIGINAGEAIVGNIGCIGRMDYTAIGDTVNTASRLESKAKPGQILLSSTAIRALEERGKYASVGMMSLKGKANEVEAFELTSINKPVAPMEKIRKECLLENNLLHTKIRPDR